MGPMVEFTVGARAALVEHQHKFMDRLAGICEEVLGNSSMQNPLCSVPAGPACKQIVSMHVQLGGC